MCDLKCKVSSKLHQFKLVSILHKYLIAHDPGEVLKELLEGSEFFGTDRDHGALEELVIVDEKSDLGRRAT